jgi:NAD(P)-dependent dehydrogenase (short-subunit alcohol dehydrogenase family)
LLKKSGEGKICVITGAASGIGLQIGLSLAMQGTQIIAICRNEERAKQTEAYIKLETGNKKVEGYAADLSIQSEIWGVGRRIRNNFDHVDILINDAACVASWFQLTPDGIEKVFAVNHIAPFLLTHTLLPLIKKSPDGRIINVSSRAHGRGTLYLDDLFLRKNFSLAKSYNQSKLCNMLFTYYLADKLKNNTITVNAFHPALVRTGIGANGVNKLHKWLWQAISVLGRPAYEAAKDGVYLALSEEVMGANGKFFHNQQQIKSSIASYNKEWQQRLWDISLHLTNLRADEYGQIS